MKRSARSARRRLEVPRRRAAQQLEPPREVLGARRRGRLAARRLEPTGGPLPRPSGSGRSRAPDAGRLPGNAHKNRHHRIQRPRDTALSAHPQGRGGRGQRRGRRGRFRERKIKHTGRHRPIGADRRSWALHDRGTGARAIYGEREHRRPDQCRGRYPTGGEPWAADQGAGYRPGNWCDSLLGLRLRQKAHPRHLTCQSCRSRTEGESSHESCRVVGSTGAIRDGQHERDARREQPHSGTLAFQPGASLTTLEV